MYRRTFVAIVVPTLSGSDWSHIGDASLATHLLPSLHLSLSQADRWMFSIQVFVVFDAGDVFWEQGRNMKALRATTTLAVHFVRVKKSTRIPHNEGCRVAYEMGADYIVRINDDTEFVSNGWLIPAVRALNSFTPKRFGVVGPTCEQGNNEILTHDMVHRTHLDIFHDYYPPEFDNWWLDDWISHVYGDSHTRRLSDWVVLHNVHTYGTRYEARLDQKDMLPTILLRSQRELIDFLTLNRRQSMRASVLSSGNVTLLSVS